VRLAPPRPLPSHSRRQRALLALVFIVLSLGSLGAAFFRTQVVRNHDFVLRSEENRLRVVPIPAPRGTIYDRHGAIVAETATGYALFLEPAPRDSIEARLRSLLPYLELEEESILALHQRHARHPREPLQVSGALSFEQVSRIEENRHALRGIVLETRPVRRYPQGRAIAHLIGYVAEITEGELQDTSWAGYRMGQEIGRSGVERQHERLLGGRLGSRYLEVDAHGRIVGSLATEAAVRPVPGSDLHLTLDLELQRFIDRIFPEDKPGSVVAMVPSTGEILALYSHPTYDPNLFTGGVSPRVWRQLNSDPGRPLLNRATHGIYPPGSTWKLATAIVALERGVITPTQRMPIACTGGMSYAGHYSRCWKREGHGSLDLAGAIAHSCNVYFYQLGIRLGVNALAQAGTRLGFGRRTGVDLPTESAGTFPDDAEWYRRRFGWMPTPSEVMSLAIGQGPNSQTPLRMAQFFSALAGDGTAARPHLVRTGGAQVETDLGVRSGTLEAVRLGLARVVEPGGTAYMSSLKDWKLYGKTGTSQNPHDPKRPHAWFTGFAGPRDAPPEIVVAVIVEFGEGGSAVAAPIAAKVADFYLNRSRGLPVEEAQTLRERLEAGRPVRVVAAPAPDPDSAHIEQRLAD
jgi:penicillin-binding protein 2